MRLGGTDDDNRLDSEVTTRDDQRYPEVSTTALEQACGGNDEGRPTLPGGIDDGNRLDSEVTTTDDQRYPEVSTTAIVTTRR